MATAYLCASIRIDVRPPIVESVVICSQSPEATMVNFKKYYLVELTKTTGESFEEAFTNMEEVLNSLTGRRIFGWVLPLMPKKLD